MNWLLSITVQCEVNCALLRRVLFLVFLFAQANNISAETLIYELHIKDHLFYPSVLTIPASKKIKLLIFNDDLTPEEFESYELNREKVIMGKSKGVIFLGPLKAGKYPFFGEFNPETAQGNIEVK
ncbi:MAG: cupredoxin domain-containing protein [Gammaproteobacteria bacterium]|jgi:hypothetical protein|nr:cupredoxin domain-containing protein [Gammaproteobacteria bacterium]